jgi:hypothetical protein
MSHYDDHMKEGLSKDDEAFLKDLEDGRGLFTQFGATLTGPLGGWGMYALIMAFAMFGLLIWSGFAAWGADDLRLTVLWSAVSISLVVALGMIKLWMFSRMNHLMVLRELKMIELRIVLS